MKLAIHIIYLFLAMTLSPTLFSAIEIFGVKPNLFLIYLVIAGFYTSKTEAIWLGLIFGFAFDIIVGVNIGTCGILYMLACFFITLICENMIRRSNFIVILLLTTVWTIVFEGITAIVSGGTAFLESIKIISIEAVYNVLLSVLIYAPLRKIMDRIYDEKG